MSRLRRVQRRSIEGSTSIGSAGRSLKAPWNFCRSADLLADFSSAPLCFELMIRNLRHELRGPAGDHATQSVPTGGDNQHNMRNHKHYEEPHQPKVPNAGLVKSAEDGCKPGQLRRFVNCPSSGDSEEASSRNGKIGEPLKGVVFCAKAKMPLPAPGQYGVG